MVRIGCLPLIHQSGERWLHHIPARMLAVLIARLATCHDRDTSGLAARSSHPTASGAW